MARRARAFKSSAGRHLSCSTPFLGRVHALLSRNCSRLSPRDWATRQGLTICKGLCSLSAACCCSWPQACRCCAGPPNPEPTSAQAPQAKSAKPALAPDALDRLHAPIALYPDQLLAQMFLCAQNPGKVAALGEWLAAFCQVKGTDLQDAATKSGFEPSFVAMTLFPDVVNAMASDLEWTTHLGQAFAADRTATFASIQRLRGKAKAAGTLKSTPQQDVETRTTSSGEQVIVIEPANPQVVYVPQYNRRWSTQRPPRAAAMRLPLV